MLIIVILCLLLLSYIDYCISILIIVILFWFLLSYVDFCYSMLIIVILCWLLLSYVDYYYPMLIILILCCQIISSEKIGVYGMNSVEGSCDGFLAFPVSALGTVHYTLSYFPPNHKSQIGLIATRNGTVVNVTLRLVTRPVFNLIWNGTMYQNGQTISIPMNQYDTVQLQDNSDLTGTLVVSNFPIAVFSGNDYSAVWRGFMNI